MRRLALVALVILAACSPADDSTEPASTTPTSTVATASTTTSSSSSIPPTPAPSREDRAIAAARDAVRAAGVMTTEFADTAIAEVSTTDDVIEVVLLPPNPDTLGATAVITLSVADLAVLDVRHYR